MTGSESIAMSFGSDFLYAVLAFALVLIPAIIIHELGHFFAAKMVGINVLEFGIGFPPKMRRLFMWGETEFTLNWLPIGGFVRPLGEDFIGPVDLDEQEEKRKNDDHYISERDELLARGVPESKMLSVNQAKPLPRIFFMVMGAGANFVSAIVVFMIIALLGLPEVIGARVQVTILPNNGVFTGTDVAPGDAIEQINGELFQTSAEFLQRWVENSGKPIVVGFRSIETNKTYELTVTPKSSIINPQVLILGVAVESPGYEAGLLPGDAIFALDGEPIPADTDPSAYLQQHTKAKAGQEIRLSVWREGKELSFTLTPRVDPPPGQGQIGLSIMSQFATDDGIVFAPSANQTKLIPQPVGKSIEYGFARTFETISLIVAIPSQIIQGKISPEEARPVSIIGISQVGGKFLKQSVEDGSPSLILQFFALISIFLGFTNLLPLPPLDGGRVVFVLIEMVRGKPVPPAVEMAVYKVGITLLLSLGVIVILLDIIKPVVLP